MGKRTYTSAHDAFLRRHPILDRVILTALFNKEFGESRTVAQIRNHCRRELGLKMTRTTNFKKDNVPWNKGKSVPVSENAKKHWFKKGHVYHEKPIGYVCFKKGGFEVIKVKIGSLNPHHNFAKKHRYLYEQHHGVTLDKEKDVVIFLDGNKQNFDINNLVKVSRSVLGYLIKTNFYSQPIELRHSLIAMARLHIRLLKL